MLRGILAVLAAGALGSGSLGNGAMGGGSLGVPTTMQSATTDCLAGALLDYDAYALSSGALSAWANDGSGGSGWDMAQGVGANRPTVTGTCGSASGNCVHMVDASDYITQSAASAASWDETFICAAFVDDATGTNYLMSWDDVTSSNYIGTDETFGYFMRGNAGTTLQSGGTQSSGWHTVCLDMTAPATATLWVDGVATLSSVDISPATDPVRMSIGAIASSGTTDATGVKFGRVMAWNGSHCTASEIHDAIFAQRGLP